MLKTILFFWAVLFIAGAQADYRVTWETPTENTDGSPLTDLDGYNLWCIPTDRTYGQPLKLPRDAVEYVGQWPTPAGNWKCKMQSFNVPGQVSADSAEVFFTLADTDGDGNNEVVKPTAPNPDNPGGEVLPAAGFTVTRKGYYSIIKPDGNIMLKPDGSTRQTITRDETYQWITNDGQRGLFVIKQPDYEVNWE